MSLLAPPPRPKATTRVRKIVPPSPSTVITRVSAAPPPPKTPTQRIRRIKSAEPVTVNVINASVMTGLSQRQLQVLMSEGQLKNTFAGGRRLIFVDSIHALLGHTPA